MYNVGTYIPNFWIGFWNQLLSPDPLYFANEITK